ncbi:MAG: hypothetical protein ACKV2T_43500 [Kofleriaceae bacterium]
MGGGILMPLIHAAGGLFEGWHGHHEHEAGHEAEGNVGMASGGLGILDAGMHLLGSAGGLFGTGTAGGLFGMGTVGTGAGSAAGATGAAGALGWPVAMLAGGIAGGAGGMGLGHGIGSWANSFFGEGTMSEETEGNVALGLGGAGAIAGLACPALAPFLALGGAAAAGSGMLSDYLRSDAGGNHETAAEAVSVGGMGLTGAAIGAGIGSIIPAAGTGIGAAVGGGIGLLGGLAMSIFGD